MQTTRKDGIDPRLLKMPEITRANLERMRQWGDADERAAISAQARGHARPALRQIGVRAHSSMTPFSMSHTPTAVAKPIATFRE